MLVHLTDNEVEIIALALVRFTRETAIAAEDIEDSYVSMVTEGCHEYDSEVMQLRWRARELWDYNRAAALLREREPFSQVESDRLEHFQF